VDALVILRWRQHRTDQDGWLVAEDRDLIEEKLLTVFCKVAHYTDLTEAEAKLIGVKSLGTHMTQRELTEALGLHRVLCRPGSPLSWQNLPSSRKIMNRVRKSMLQPEDAD
jgi:hypothetical protein